MDQIYAAAVLANVVMMFDVWCLSRMIWPLVRPLDLSSGGLPAAIFDFFACSAKALKKRRCSVLMYFLVEYAGLLCSFQSVTSICSKIQCQVEKRVQLLQESTKCDVQELEEMLQRFKFASRDAL